MNNNYDTFLRKFWWAIKIFFFFHRSCTRNADPKQNKNLCNGSIKSLHPKCAECGKPKKNRVLLLKRKDEEKENCERRLTSTMLQNTKRPKIDQQL